ncbi:MAG: ribose-phosphate pyrophosphokinase [bacterium]|nr:ribose-phosphate pyrophosphokinase [bacterium]
MILLSGTSNIPLAQAIAKEHSVPLGNVEITRFIDNECRVRVIEEVEGESVIVIQSLSQIADQHLMELCLIGQALKSLKARRVVACIPWMGYSKQDKQFRRGESVSAELVARFLEGAGFDDVVSIELHSENLLPYFRVPIHELSSHDVLLDAFRQRFPDASGAVVVSPDRGGQSRSQRFAEEAGLRLVYLEKNRDRHTGKIDVVGISGSVDGKNLVIFDDIINTGSTAIKTSQFLKSHGCGRMYFLATHPVFAGDAIEKLSKCPIDHIIVTDTIAIPKEKYISKLTVVSVSSLLSRALKEIVG